MRTTINLPDSLAEAAKSRAAATGQTFTSLVEQGLRAVLDQAHAAPAALDPLPAYGDASDDFLVDLDDRNALWAALDADGPR